MSKHEAYTDSVQHFQLTQLAKALTLKHLYMTKIILIVYTFVINLLCMKYKKA